MCKLLIIPKVSSDLKVQKSLWKFLKVMQPILSKYDSDGFGMMSFGDEGLSCESWLNPDDAFKLKKEMSDEALAVEQSYSGYLLSEIGYKKVGKINNVIYSCALHARQSTNVISIANTHPFVRVEDGVTSALIHNGIVSTDNLELKTTSCDSEGILNLYVDKRINFNPEAISEMTTLLRGYYACAIYSQGADGSPILDIVKDAKAYLEAVWIPKLGGVVFCTNSDLVKLALKLLGWKVGATFMLEDNVLIRHCALTGKVLEIRRFQPALEVAKTGADYWNDKHPEWAI
jgi:hypothetical protein